MLSCALICLCCVIVCRFANLLKLVFDEGVSLTRQESAISAVINCAIMALAILGLIGVWKIY